MTLTLHDLFTKMSERGQCYNIIIEKMKDNLQNSS